MPEVPIKPPRRQREPDVQPRPETPRHPKPRPEPGIGEPMPLPGEDPGVPPGPRRGDAA